MAVNVSKQGHCHGQSFDPLFLKFIILIAYRLSRFGIAFQLSTTSTSSQNGGSKIQYGHQMYFFLQI